MESWFEVVVTKILYLNLLFYIFQWKKIVSDIKWEEGLLLLLWNTENQTIILLSCKGTLKPA